MPSISQVPLLSLLLVMAVALNLACCADWAARRAGNGRAQAALVAGGAACTLLAVFFAGASAFR